MCNERTVCSVPQPQLWRREVRLFNLQHVISRIENGIISADLHLHSRSTNIGSIMINLQLDVLDELPLYGLINV